MPTEPLRSRLLAILAADAAGYSRSMSRDERNAVAALDRGRAAFREVIAAHGGPVVDMAGDSVMSVFDTALGAVQAAVSVSSSAWPATPITTRICAFASACMSAMCWRSPTARSMATA